MQLFKKAFTLVELIVVITILTILGTIAFISFQGYSTKARNTKRKSDLNNLETQLELGKIKGIGILSFVSNNNSTITANGVNIQISGKQGYINLSGSYIAGDINYIALGVNKINFKDPTTKKSYKIGVTTLGNRYELAATIEENNATDTLVVGNWNPRKSAETNFAGNLIGNGDTFYLTGGILGIETGLQKNDTVKFASTGAYIISKIKGSSIILDRIVNIGETGQSIELVFDETRHLIKRRNSNWAIDIGRNDETYTPYKLK